MKEPSNKKTQVKVRARGRTWGRQDNYVQVEHYQRKVLRIWVIVSGSFGILRHPQSIKEVQRTISGLPIPELDNIVMDHTSLSLYQMKDQNRRPWVRSRSSCCNDIWFSWNLSLFLSFQENIKIVWETKLIFQMCCQRYLILMFV